MFDLCNGEELLNFLEKYMKQNKIQFIQEIAQIIIWHLVSERVRLKKLVKLV